MNNLNIAEKFLAFDDIYEGNGSNFYEIYVTTKLMFDNIKDNKVLSKYIDDDFIINYLNNIYFCQDYISTYNYNDLAEKIEEYDDTKEEQKPINTKEIYVDNYDIDNFGGGFKISKSFNLKIKENKISKLIENFKSLSFFTVFLSSSFHAFSISFSKNLDNTYNLMFFNSGLGSNMHPIKIEGNNDLTAACLFKNNIKEKDIKKILECIKKYFSTSDDFRIEKVYDVLIAKIFLPDEIYNVHLNDNDEVKKAYYLNDYIDESNKLYITSQATGNCTGRAIFYPILFYFSKKYNLSIQESFNKLMILKTLISYTIYLKILDNFESLDMEKINITNFKTNTLNENLELVNIIKLLTDFYSKDKLNYLIESDIYFEENEYLKECEEKIRIFDIKKLINYNYYNFENDNIEILEKDINIKDLITKPINKHNNIKTKISIIENLEITNNEEYFIFLENLDEILDNIIDIPTNRDSILRIIYYSVILKKALLSCYNKVNTSHLLWLEKERIVDLNIKINQIIEKFLSIKQVNYEIKGVNIMTSNYYKEFNLLTYYFNSIVLFLFINLEFYKDNFMNKRNKYKMTFKKLLMDDIDKSIKPISNYYFNLESDASLNDFKDENMINSMINSHDILNHLNIKTSDYNENIKIIYFSIIHLYINLTKIINKNPLISNTFKFYDYINKIKENGIIFINFNRIDNFNIDISTYYSIEKSDFIDNIDKKFRNINIGFSDYFDKTIECKNIFINDINDILSKLNESSNIKKDNITNLLENIILFYKIHKIKYSSKLINKIIQKYEIKSIIINNLLGNDLISNKELTKIIKNNNLKLTDIYDKIYCKYTDSSIDNNVKLSFYNNFVKLENLYDNINEFYYYEKIFGYLPIIINQNLEYFDKIIKNSDFLRIGNLIYLNKGNTFYSHKTKHAINFDYLNTNINLIIETDLILPIRIQQYLNILARIFSEYKNIDIFNNRIFKLSDDLKTFESSDNKYKIDILTYKIYYNSDFNKKKLIKTNKTKNQKLQNFIDNVLSFENKIFIEVYEEKSSYLIYLSRYNLQIEFINDKFFINKKTEIITNFTDNIYLYKWIYGTNNLLITKTNNTFQILVFNKNYNFKNKSFEYKKVNYYWKKPQKFIFNIYSDDFEYYFININSNLLFLDIDINNNKSLFYLCYTYIFYNKTNELINLLNIINSKIKNNISDDYTILLAVFIKLIDLNTPFNKLIKSYFIIDQDKFYRQKKYFENYINTTNIFNINKLDLYSYPVNFYKFLKSNEKKEEYNRNKFYKETIIDIYYANNNTTNEEIYLTPSKFQEYNKILDFLEVNDEVYNFENSDNNSYSDDESYDSHNDIDVPQRVFDYKKDYFEIFNSVNNTFYLPYKNKNYYITLTVYNYDYNLIKDSNINISNKIDLEFNIDKKTYYDLDNSKLFESNIELNNIINKFISENKEENLINISKLDKNFFIKFHENITNKILINLDNFAFYFGDIGKKIINIFNNHIENSELIYNSIILKTIIDIINLYNELENTDMSNKTIIHDEISRKINKIESYHNNKSESIYVHIFEYIFGFFISEEQNILINKIYNQFISEPQNRTFHQLLMGAGKTSVVNPLLNLKLINTHKNFIINVLPDSLVNQSLNILINTLKYIFNIDVINYNINRQTPLENITFENRKVYLMSDSSYKSYYLNCIEKNKSSYEIFRDNAFVIIDEVDLVSDTTKSETNYPLKGSKKPVHLNKEFTFIYRIVDILENNYPKDHKINEFLLREPNILLLEEDKYYDVLEYYKPQLLELINEFLNLKEKNIINNDLEELLFNKELKFNEDILDKEILENLYFVRTIFNDILPLVIKQKHRLNFGFVNEFDFDKDYNYNYIAIPYLALDIPAYNKINKISSEFSNYYIKIFLTYISFTATNSYYLRIKDIQKIVKYVSDIYIDIKTKSRGVIPDNEIKILQIIDYLKILYSIDKDISIFDVDYTKFNLSILLENIKDPEKLIIYKALIKKYIKYLLNEYIRIDENVYNCSFIDVITPNYSKYTSGYTGTPYLFIPYNSIDTKEYNVNINHNDYGKIISGMTNKFTDAKINYIDNNSEIYSVLRENNYSVLIDAGSYFINKTAYEVIKEIKKEFIKNKDNKYKNFIFIDSDHIKKYINLDNDNMNLFNESFIELNDRFIYFDNGHITGQDFKLVPNVKGMITVNFENNFRDVAQGIFRLRKLNYGQTISYCLYNTIKKINNIKNLEDLILWLINNNEKSLDNKNLLGLIQNIRREIKCNCNDYFVGQIENFKPKNTKEFYFNTFNFIINNLINQYKNSTYSINSEEKLDPFVKYLLDLYTSKYSLNKLILQTQEQEQVQLQNVLQQIEYQAEIPKFNYLYIKYFYNRSLDYDDFIYYQMNYNNSLEESLNLYNIDKNKYPLLHLFVFKTRGFSCYITHFITNYVNLCQNLNYYSDKENYFRLYDLNGKKILDNFKKEEDYDYFIKNEEVVDFENYIHGKIINYSILNNYEINNFNSILLYIKYFFETPINDILNDFDIKNKYKNIKEKYYNFVQIINNYIKSYNSNKNLLFLKNLLKLNILFIDYDNFIKKINYIINNILIKCISIDKIDLNNKDIFLLLLILGIDKESIDYENNCGLIVCKQMNYYILLNYFKKNSFIRKLFSKYNDEICKIINNNIDKDDIESKLELTPHDYSNFLTKNKEKRELLLALDFIK